MRSVTSHSSFRDAKWGSLVLVQIPGQRRLKTFLVLTATIDIEPLVLIGFPVGCSFNYCFMVLTLEREDSRDERVVCFTEDTHGTKEVLSRSLQTVWEDQKYLVRGTG